MKLPFDKNYLISVLASLFPAALAFFFFPMYARILGPEAYGIVALLECCQAMGSIFLLCGMPAAFYTFYNHAKTEVEKSTVFSTSIFFSTGVFIFLLALSSFFPFLSVLLFAKQNLSFYLAIYAFSIFSDYLLTIVNALLRVEGKMHKMAANVFVLCSLQHGFSLYALLWYQGGLDAFIYAFLASRIFIFILACCRIYKLPFKIAHISKDLLFSALKFGAPLVLNSFTMWALLLADRFFISAYGSLADTGVYTVAYKFASCVYIALVQPFIIVWEPSLFKAFTADKESGYLKLSADFKLYFMALALIFSAQLLFLEDLIAILFAKTAYSQGIFLFPYLIGSQFLMATGEMWGSVCRLHKTSKFAFAASCAALSIKLVLNFSLIPKFLLLGAAISSFTAELCSQVVIAYYAYRAAGTRNLFFNKNNLCLMGYFLLLLLASSFHPPLWIKLTLFGLLLAICVRNYTYKEPVLQII